MLLTIIFDFRVIKLRNYHKISHLGHVNEILMQNPVCAMWRLIRVEQKIVWLYKQLVYCPDHNVITISQQWCDCTRPWSEGRREGGHLAVPGIVCVLPLYCLCILLRMTHSTRRLPAAAAERMKVIAMDLGKYWFGFVGPLHPVGMAVKTVTCMLKRPSHIPDS